MNRPKIFADVFVFDCSVQVNVIEYNEDYIEYNEDYLTANILDSIAHKINVNMTTRLDQYFYWIGNVCTRDNEMFFTKSSYYTVNFTKIYRLS